LPETQNTYLLEFWNLLQRVFKNLKLSNAGAMFNSVYVAIRLHYLNPVSERMGYHDGVGSAKSN
jgi:hypothetical protein